MAIVFVTVAPLGTATTSLSRYVAGVERILRDSGTTAVIVTHEPEDAMRMTDRTMLLQAGTGA